MPYTKILQMLPLLNKIHHLEVLSLKGGCTGSSESLFVKMPHCWKSYVAAHIVFFQMAEALRSATDRSLCVIDEFGKGTDMVGNGSY